MRTDKLSCQKYLLLKNKGTPSRKDHKTGFSVLTTIELNLLVKFTYLANNGLYEDVILLTIQLLYYRTWVSRIKYTHVKAGTF